MYKSLLSLSILSFTALAEMESRPNYHCTEAYTVTVKHDGGEVSTSRSQYDLEYFLINVSNVPEKVLLELGKTLPAYHEYAQKHENTDLSDPEVVRTLMNQLSEVWEYGGYMSQESLETSKLTPPVYLMFKQPDQLNNANYYTRTSRCVYTDGISVESGLSWSMDSDISKFRVDLETQRFESVNLSNWIQTDGETRTTLTYGLCKPGYTIPAAG